LAKLKAIIQHAVDAMMYGKITIHFKKGVPVKVIREESIEI